MIDSLRLEFCRVDTKLTKRLTRFNPTGFKNRIFKHYTTFYTNVKSNSEFRKQQSILNFITSDKVGLFKIVPHHAVSTESKMSTSSLRYGILNF